MLALPVQEVMAFDKRTWENDLGCDYTTWDEIGIERKALDDHEDEGLKKASEGQH
jgi:hypothetical protein